MEVNVKERVLEFSQHLAPETRRALKQALRDLRAGRGHVRELEGNLAGYHRLRVGRYRLILRYLDAGHVDALFMEDRSIVYEVFAAELVKTLKSSSAFS